MVRLPRISSGRELFLHLSAPFLAHVSPTYRIHDLDQIIVLNIRLDQYRRVCLSGYWSFRRVSILDSNSRSYLSSFSELRLPRTIRWQFPALLYAQSLDAEIRRVYGSSTGVGRDVQFHDGNMRKHGGYQKKNHQNGKDIHHRYQFNTRMMSVSKDSAFGLLRHRLDMINSDRIDASQYWRSLELALTESRNVLIVFTIAFPGCSQYSPLLSSCAREVIKAGSRTSDQTRCSSWLSNTGREQGCLLGRVARQLP